MLTTHHEITTPQYINGCQLPAVVVARDFHQLLDKQPNFSFGLAGICAAKIQLRFQKRSPAAVELIPGRLLFQRL